MTRRSGSSSLPWLSIDFENRLAALLQLAQIAQPLFELAQLYVVELAGRFLAITRDERNGGPAVEKADRRLHLPGVRRQFAAQPLDN